MKFLFNSDLARLESLLGEDLISKEISAPKLLNKDLSKTFSFRKNIKAFEEDYPTFLLSLASSIRTGLDPIDAMRTVTEMLPERSILRKELTILNNRLETGESEEDAILSFGQSINHPDVSLLITSLLLARKEGSSLGVCLQRLNKVTRQRQSFRRKAKAAVAMQRLSSLGICGCSIAIGIIQVSMNPESFFKAVNHPLGGILISAGALLLITGAAWMLYLGRSRI